MKQNHQNNRQQCEEYGHLYRAGITGEIYQFVVGFLCDPGIPVHERLGAVVIWKTQKKNNKKKKKKKLNEKPTQCVEAT